MNFPYNWKEPHLEQIIVVDLEKFYRSEIDTPLGNMQNKT